MGAESFPALQYCNNSPISGPQVQTVVSARGAYVRAHNLEVKSLHHSANCQMATTKKDCVSAHPRSKVCSCTEFAYNFL